MPLDVSYPISLLDDILQDAEPVVIIAQSDLTQYLKSEYIILYRFTIAYL